MNKPKATGKKGQSIRGQPLASGRPQVAVVWQDRVVTPGGYCQVGGS